MYRGGRRRRGAAFEVLPTIQMAAVRVDRPDDGAAISGTAVSSATVTHYAATSSGATSFWFRRGLAYRLTSGTKVSAQAKLYTSFRSCGTVFPAREVVFNPTNDVNLASWFPVTGPFAAVGVAKSVSDIAQERRDCEGVCGSYFDAGIERNSRYRHFFRHLSCAACYQSCLNSPDCSWPFKNGDDEFCDYRVNP